MTADEGEIPGWGSPDLNWPEDQVMTSGSNEQLGPRKLWTTALKTTRPVLTVFPLGLRGNDDHWRIIWVIFSLSIHTYNWVRCQKSVAIVFWRHCNLSRKECRKLILKWNMDRIISAGVIHSLILVFIYGTMRWLTLTASEVYSTI